MDRQKDNLDRNSNGGRKFVENDKDKEEQINPKMITEMINSSIKQAVQNIVKECSIAPTMQVSTKDKTECYSPYQNGREKLNHHSNSKNGKYHLSSSDENGKQSRKKRHECRRNVKTDNRKMTGNVNIYICSETTEDRQEKNQTENMESTETCSETTEKSTDYPSNKLMNNLKKKSKKFQKLTDNELGNSDVETNESPSTTEYRNLSFEVNKDFEDSSKKFTPETADTVILSSGDEYFDVDLALSQENHEDKSGPFTAQKSSGFSQFFKRISSIMKRSKSSSPENLKSKKKNGTDLEKRLEIVSVESVPVSGDDLHKSRLCTRDEITAEEIKKLEGHVREQRLYCVVGNGKRNQAKSRSPLTSGEKKEEKENRSEYDEINLCPPNAKCLRRCKLREILARKERSDTCKTPRCKEETEKIETAEENGNIPFSNGDKPIGELSQERRNTRNSLEPSKEKEKNETNGLSIIDESEESKLNKNYREKSNHERQIVETSETENEVKYVNYDKLGKNNGSLHHSSNHSRVSNGQISYKNHNITSPHCRCKYNKNSAIRTRPSSFKFNTCTNILKNNRNNSVDRTEKRKHRLSTATADRKIEESINPCRCKASRYVDPWVKRACRCNAKVHTEHYDFKDEHKRSARSSIQQRDSQNPRNGCPCKYTPRKSEEPTSYRARAHLAHETISNPPTDIVKDNEIVLEEMKYCKIYPKFIDNFENSIKTMNYPVEKEIDEYCYRDKLEKPYGSDGLPYQRFHVFSDVLDELHRKMSGSTNYKRRKDAPSRLCECNNKNEARRKNIPAQERNFQKANEQSREQNVRARCTCDNAPCRCKKNAPYRRPRAKCYYCKSSPCV